MSIKKAKNLYIDLAVSKDENRYGEDVYLVYNPDGYGGVQVAGKETIDLINQFDGNIDKETAIKNMGLTGEDQKSAEEFVNTLIDKQILIVEDKINHRKFPRHITCWMHITNGCNLNCRYCYIHKDNTQMSDEVLYKSINMLIESCKRNNYETLTLMFVGGEPLTRFDKIKEVVDYCSKNCGNIKINYDIPTNGTLITPEVAKFLTSNKFNVGVSIDGIEKYNDINRISNNGNGSYAKAMEGIENLLKYKFKPSIMTTVTNENLDGLPELTKELIKKKIYFRFSFERDAITGDPAILHNEKHCIEIMNQCFNIMMDALKNNELGWTFKFGDTGFEMPRRRACAAGSTFFAIGQDGSVGSCSIGLQKTRTSIFEMNDIITDVRNIFSDVGKTSACDVDECKKCIWRHSCAGACPLQTYATYNTYLHTSPYCSIYKACLPQVIRIHAFNWYCNIRKEE